MRVAWRLKRASAATPVGSFRARVARMLAEALNAVGTAAEADAYPPPRFERWRETDIDEKPHGEVEEELIVRKPPT